MSSTSIHSLSVLSAVGPALLIPTPHREYSSRSLWRELLLLLRQMSLPSAKFLTQNSTLSLKEEDGRKPCYWVPIGAIGPAGTYSIWRVLYPPLSSSEQRVDNIHSIKMNSHIQIHIQDIKIFLNLLFGLFFSNISSIINNNRTNFDNR